MTLCLTVRQPWAWSIIHAGKDVENRSWPSPHAGLIGIHAGQIIESKGRARLERLGIEMPDELTTGAIIGTVEIVGCLRGYESPWAERGGSWWHWVLDNPRAIEPIPWMGQPGLWEGPEL